MNSDIISPRQAVAMLSVLLISGTAASVNIYTSGQNTWIALAVGIAVSVLIFIVYAVILELFKSKNIFEISCDCFGNAVGKIISAAITGYAVLRAIIAIRGFCEMVTITSLTETPILFVAVFVMLTAAFMIKSGLYVMGKCSLLFVVIIVAVTVVTTALSVGVMQFENIFPGEIKFSPLIRDAVSIASHPFGDAVLVLCMFSHIKNDRSRKKIFLLALLIAGAVMLVAMVRDILILGGETFSTLYFPSYSATGIINIYNFIQRIAVFDAVKTLFSVLIEVSVCLYCVSKGISFLVRYDSYKSMVFPVAMLIAVLSAAAFSSTMQLTAFSRTVSYIALPAEIILCLVILLIGIFKRKVKENL